MTDEQRAELEQLDAAIAAAPDEWQPLRNRHWFLCYTACDFDMVVEAATRMLRVHRPDAADGVSEWGRWRSHLVVGARENWKKGGSQVETMRRFYRSECLAAFETVLQDSPDLAVWLAARGPEFDALKVLEHARLLTFCVPSDWERATDDELKFWALAIAIARDDRVAADVYSLFLRRQFGAKRRSPAARRCAPLRAARA